jgi:peptide/nickel transport system substrate-binding protein
LAIDRWKAAETLSESTFLKFVGGILRPGFAMATPEAALISLPGFSRDIAASRAEARRLLAEAGAQELQFTLTNRNVPIPYGPGADYLIEAWRQIGIAARQVQLNTKDWQSALEKGEFEAALDFVGDYFDDPTLQLTKYVSTDLSPINFSKSSDNFLDALYIGQAITAMPAKRAAIVRDFERHAMAEAYSVPFLWWNRIVVTSSHLKGWSITPSHYLNQDLAEVWLE